MEHIDCSACLKETEARPPNLAFMALIAAFWTASLLIGFGAAQGPGWVLILGSTWVVLAASVVLFARRATSWTCADCGSAVPPPLGALAKPLRGGLGSREQLRHA